MESKAGINRLPSKLKLLEEMRSKELNRIQKQIQQLERELETKRQEQDVLKEETLRVIQGKSGLDRDMLADLVAENKEAVLRAGDALQKAKQEQKEVEEAAKKCSGNAAIFSPGQMFMTMRTSMNGRRSCISSSKKSGWGEIMKLISS